jgi:acyl-coenzyme A thioesterase PaaI-like protein
VPLAHHELCFGCGRTNLFGVMLELEATGPGEAEGRCFIKQDHQGADRGAAHEGVIAAALSEAMALSCGPNARARRLELELGGHAPVGTFVEITATCDGELAHASAFADGALIARASGTYAS